MTAFEAAFILRESVCINLWGFTIDIHRPWTSQLNVTLRGSSDTFVFMFSNR